MCCYHVTRTDPAPLSRVPWHPALLMRQGFALNVATRPGLLRPRYECETHGKRVWSHPLSRPLAGTPRDERPRRGVAAASLPVL
ncbi:hypothetical protein E2C01_060530 [Portunus trituberculatus]|uniref:Uncharacterized protein n=1 Tax=Portunus trituberculatus TaxID=210409 RepID=A0A5B7H8B9_PORTR|nr:hypothetical protein [Portunus trituberculatus]